jgi:FAD/FMN-containing dehydrogenase
LSDGALPVKDGVVISLARMNRILEVDLPNARVVVEPGVINLEVTGRVAPHGFFYALGPMWLIPVTALKITSRKQSFFSRRIWFHEHN